MPKRGRLFDGSKANICFKCDNACGGCSWSRNLTPVKGWDAELVYYSPTGGFTYHIMGCPQFKKTPDRKTSNLCLNDVENAIFLATHGERIR